MLSFKRMSEVKDQLKWIANHNYDSYDSPTSQSNGSVAVYKADVEQLLNMVDWADKYEEVDSDGMQGLLIDEVVFLRKSEGYFTQVKTSVEFHIIGEIKKWVATSAARGFIR